MHFHANYVSTSVFGDGDYYQATFQAEPDTDDADRQPLSPYLLIQRQFDYLEDRTTIAFAGMIEREFGGFVPPPSRA
jgi:hypothetical protein